ncbi:translation initiation factor IF-2-like [Gymnogyps californianus]|uniref:translation initiation factor IF-2-like n=1 Tax=Gymnogyps californianus TaxID=33616 RepID=UPI0021C67A44|nr:translation initiation factor IF-2-like [Gymnogyps californianus]
MRPRAPRTWAGPAPRPRSGLRPAFSPRPASRPRLLFRRQNRAATDRGGRRRDPGQTGTRRGWGSPGAAADPSCRRAPSSRHRRRLVFSPQLLPGAAAGRTDPSGLALALPEPGRARTAQSVLWWEQRPLQGPTPAPAAPWARRWSRPGRARAATAIPVPGGCADAWGRLIPVPGRGAQPRGGERRGTPAARTCPVRDGRTDGRRTPATPGAAEPPGRSRAACAQADAAACPAPGWGQPCLARPVTPRLQLSCLGPRLFWVPFQLPVPSVWSCGLLSVAAPARGRLQFRLQAQLSFGSCSSSWTAPAHFHARLRMVPARVWLQLPLLATSSWSAAPARAC